MTQYSRLALEHIRYLSETIGGRGSCTPQAHLAAEYIYQELEKLGAQQVAYQPFQGRPSTYRPFIYAFGAALAGSLLALLLGERWALALGAMLNLLGAWAMFAETEFKNHWARSLSPSLPTRNVTGIISPAGRVEKRIVLCAHFDTHRTPVFYSSAGWQRLFGLLVSAAFISMALGGLAFGLAGITGWIFLRWAGLLLIPFQVFVLVMVTSADFTPFSPGANDNASGVGVVLGLANHLLDQPLRRSEVHLVFTDCEETGAHGMNAYLDQAMQSSGEEAVYIVLDEVGTGRVKYITNDGLVAKHPTHPLALELERRSAAALERPALETTGTAYTDALPATLRGRIAITICSVQPGHAISGTHWHQMSDRIEFVNEQSLADSHQFAWNIIQMVDEGEAV